MNIRSLVEGTSQRIRNYCLEKRTGIRVGETLEEVWRRNFLNWKHRDPFTIPPGLIVSDGQGNSYLTGQEEWEGGQDFAGIILYRLEEAKKCSGEFIEPLLGPSALAPFTVIGFNDNVDWQRRFLQSSTKLSVAQYWKSEYHLL